MEKKEMTMQERLEALKNNRFHIHRADITKFAENYTADASDDTPWMDAAEQYAIEHKWENYYQEFLEWKSYVKDLDEEKVGYLKGK